MDRLNGVVKQAPQISGAVLSTSASNGGGRPANPVDRNRQLQRLADMGVAVPEDFRKEAAMAGEWEVTSQRIIIDGRDNNDGLKKEEGAEHTKPPLNVGFRKRKLEGQEEEEEAKEKTVRMKWGSAKRSYRGTNENDDLDALLSSTRVRASTDPSVKTEVPDSSGQKDAMKPEQSEFHSETPVVKVEETIQASDTPSLDAVKGEDEPIPTFTFKKRKPKPKVSRGRS